MGGKSRSEDLSELPPLVYSSPGSRWVDPALGFDYKSAGLPHLYEVTWTIGSPEVSCEDPLLRKGRSAALRNARHKEPSAALLRALLRAVAVYIGALHSADAGFVRYHYYRKRQERGYLKIDVNGELIAAGWNGALLGMERVFRELARLRAVLEHTRSIESKTVGFVPIVLFGAERDHFWYLESLYGVPDPNAYFNSRSIEFLARLAPLALGERLHTFAQRLNYDSLREDSNLMRFLKFEPLLEKQLNECPPELVPGLVRQVVAAAAAYE